MKNPSHWRGFLLIGVYYFFLSNTDQIVPMNVITAPVTSCTIVSSTSPFISKRPPTNVRPCLTIPINCSFDNFIFFWFNGL